MRTVILAGLFVTILVPGMADAQYPNALLTPSERMAMLAERSNSSAWTKIQSSVSGSATNTSSYQGNYRARYLSASLGDRVKIAELIGEEGVEQYASTQRMKQLLGPRNRSIAIGPDSVYWNPASGKVSVLEAKGGSSQPKLTYGARQGTNANTIRSARGILHTSRAALSEKFQAARVLKAAQSGHLETAVVRTQHVLGTPLAPRQVGSVDLSNVSREARSIQRELINRNPELRTIFRNAGIQNRVNRLNHFGTTLFPQIGDQRLTAIASMPSASATAGGRGLQRAWSVGGRYVLPAGLIVAGTSVMINSYRFRLGRMNLDELLQVSTAPAIFLTFTASGAVIGGLSSAGVGAIPGATVGAMLALPVEIYLWLFSDNTRQSGYLNAQQRGAVDDVLKEIYLVSVN
ncbi:MAG: hypothetical protein F4234_02080 [Gammaproteobacteria bacterium]|nr:hypothetical protein [Gammaproteobacteria bacterium]